MKLGLAAWGLRETPLEQQLAMAVRLNVELLELSIGNHPNDFIQLDSSLERRREAAALFSRYGIACECAGTGNDFTGADRSMASASLERVKQTVDIAAELGCRWLRIFAGFSPASEVTGKRWSTMIECLAAVYDHAEGTGVTPVIETHGGVESISGGIRHFASTSTGCESWGRMLKELPDSARILFDPANLRAVGDEAPEEFFSRFRERISAMHLKDFAAVSGSGAIRPAACGEGMIDNDRLYSAIRDFAGPALIEYEIPEDVEDGFCRSLVTVHKYLR